MKNYIDWVLQDSMKSNPHATALCLARNDALDMNIERVRSTRACGAGVGRNSQFHFSGFFQKLVTAGVCVVQSGFAAELQSGFGHCHGNIRPFFAYDHEAAFLTRLVRCRLSSCTP